MAEAVGLAASIAGLIGLTGRIIQSTLFIQKFFKDIRDAPEEARISPLNFCDWC
jgi:hypothetical protein